MRQARTILPERNLDILRAVAVLAVFADHLMVMGLHVAPGLASWLGTAGVQAFFVHTSLVLMSSMERDDAPARTKWVRRFYVRRAFRIYPLAWVMIGVALLVGHSLNVPGAASGVVSPSTLLSNLALIQNLAGRDAVYGVLWTLPIELQMYAVLPICYLVAIRESRELLLCLVAVGIGVAAVHAWGMSHRSLVPAMSRLSMLRYAPNFLMGVVAYYGLRRRPPSSGVLPGWTWLPIVLAAFATFLWARSVTDGWWVVQTAFCAALGLLIPLVRDVSESAWSALAHTLAKYSYGIYLIHQIAIRVGFNVFPDQPLVVQLVVVILVLSAGCYLAYRFVERPGIVLGQRLVDSAVRRAPLEATAPAP
jgi:peptidoglycan/LPS O-acetylase OafA/YrhL